MNKLGKLTVEAIGHDSCTSIVMPLPNADDWNTIAEECWERWNFPNCIGALDGST